MPEITPQNSSREMTNKEEYKYKIRVQTSEYFDLKERIEHTFDLEDYILEMLTFRVHKSDPYGEIGFVCSFKTLENYHLCKLLIGPVA